MGEHRDRVAFVTGASSGIGRSVAELLAAEGAVVAVSSEDRSGLDEVVGGIVSAGGRAIAAVADVRIEDQLVGAVERVSDKLGGVDVLVTAAGIQRYGNVTETSTAQWDEVFDVNVRGAFLATRACMPHLRRSAHGAVVIVSSVQATATQSGVVAYTASKGALSALVRALAVDEASAGVRVNSVSPGSIDTPMLRESAALFAPPGGDPEQILSGWGAMHPLGRVGRGDEVAAVVSFLASSRASFITGADVRVDGGLLAALGATLPVRR